MNDPRPELARHVDFARRLARGLVRDPATTDDVAQEALAVALEHPPREPGREGPFYAPCCSGW